MSRFENYLIAMTCVAAVTLAFTFSAAAETVEVAPGVQVTKRTYKAPINEQPFFGFAPKNSEQQAADANFVNALIQAAGTREKAYEETTKRGWRAINANRMGEAAQRFNQAFLLSPEQSGVYQGFAAVTLARFRDLDATEELFKVALKQPHPMKALNADYGRFLLIAKRPKDAQPVLEQAVKDAPDFADAWTNLAWARFQNGDRAAACAAAGEATKQRPSATSANDLTAVMNAAQCK